MTTEVLGQPAEVVGIADGVMVARLDPFAVDVGDIADKVIPPGLLD